MARLHLMLIFNLGLTAVAAGQEKKDVIVDFSGGNGAPKLVKSENDALDDVKPLAGGTGPIFRLGPGDLVTLDVNGAREGFIGKSMNATIDSEEERKKKERVALFFTRTKIEHIPMPEPRQLDPKLKVGTELLVHLVVTPLDDKKPREVVKIPVNGPTNYRLDRPAEVTVKLEYATDEVVFTNRPTKDVEKLVLENWKKEVEAIPNRKKVSVREPDKIVVKAGTVATLEVKLTATRD